MQEALELAEKARGYTKTNPLVGAVIVNEGKIVGKGYHQYYGGDHAEVMALKEAADKARGASIYVTLEPCCHYGKTPPCTEAILKAGISKVYVAMEDCDKRVAGNGIKILRDKGIEVQVGLLEKEARWQNRAFIKSNQEKKPFVTLKYACSLDGKIATSTGQSKWITSEESRLDGHKYRGIVDGIVVGSNTALLDNPILNNRSKRGKNPYKILLDRRLKVPINWNIFQFNPELTYIYTSSNEVEEIKKRESLGAKVIRIGEKEKHLDLQELLQSLYDLKMGHILIEGGGELHGSFVYENLFDEVILYYAPKLLGGKEAKSAVSGLGIESLDKVAEIDIVNVERMGIDIKIHGVRRCLQEL